MYPEDDPLHQMEDPCFHVAELPPPEGLKVILPALIDTAEDLLQLRAAVPADSVTM